MLKDFEKYLKEQRLSENSCSSYISDIKQYEKYYRDSYGEDLEKLTSADIQTYKSYLKNRLNRKPATINRFFTALILSLIVGLANIGLALFGFLLFRTPGDF